MWNNVRSFSVGYVQTIPGVINAGITLQRTSVSSAGHSYPYPELLEVLCDIHTRTRNFWNFCTPVATIPGVWVQHVVYPLGTSVSSVRPCHNTPNFWKFCKASVPVPGTSVSPVRSPHPYPKPLVTSERLAQYLGYGYTIDKIPGEPCIHSGLIRRIIVKIKIHSSCEIEDSVEIHLCKLCVILRSRVLLGVSSLRI